MKNKETSLVGMLYDLLLRWRMFLIWILVGAVAFSVLGYFQSKKDAEEEAALVEEARQLYDEKMSKINTVEEDANKGTDELLTETVAMLNEKQLANVDYILDCERIYQERQDYIENSVIMKMNAQDVKKAFVVAWIYPDSLAEGLDEAQGNSTKLSLESKRLMAVTQSYANAFRTGDAAKYISEIVGIPAPYLLELITATAQTSGEVYGITVEVIHSDEQECEKIAQAVSKYLESKKADYAKIDDSFGMTIESQDIRSISDQNIIARQQDAYDKALGLKNAIEDRKAALTEYELKYYDLCKNGELTSLSKKPSTPVDINTIDLSGVDLSRFILNKDAEDGGAVKNMTELQEFVERGVTTEPGFRVMAALVGALLMAVAYGIYACFSYTYRDKVLDTDDFMQLCEIPQLGLIPTEKKKKILSAVDAWIISKRDKKKRKFSQEEAIQFSSVAAKMEADQKSADAVSLVCCGFQEKDLEICGRIKEKLEKENVKTLILNNVLYDTGAMQGLRDVKGAVLVAKAGSTFYEELSQEIEMLGRQEVPVLGGIVIA